METKELFSTSKKDIKTAAAILKDGGIVAIPTETVYGLAANAFNEDAIKKVFTAKGRPQDNPLIVHISDLKQIKQIASDFPKTAQKCAKKFWPGPLTIILPKNPNLNTTVTAGLDSVAIRMPSDKTARKIISKSYPLAAPSANISGSPSPTLAQHVIDDLSGKIDAVVVAGECKVGVESTVVSLVGEHPTLLRPGGITAGMLKKVLPDLVIDSAVENELKQDSKVLSPGLKYKHYSPKTQVILVEANTKDFIEFVNLKVGESVAALCFSEERPNIKIPAISYGSESDDVANAKELFVKLRELDSLNVQTVFAHAPQKTGIGLAVYNRLIRAAAFKVIKL